VKNNMTGTGDSPHIKSDTGYTDAINKSQSVIEFEMDGTIISANENFLSMMGYSLDEIVGQHHRIFADPKFAASDEYKEFWAALQRGEYQAAEFKRLGKNGREVWIQASYNPVFDRDGKPYKVVKFATDITEDSVRNSNYAGQIDAINRSQSVIEFEMDGTIISANENFLSMMGYNLDEIVGQHHSIFADPKFAASDEYKEFWAALQRGEYQAAEFKRLGKNGREVWIQGSYNPIFDRSGKPYKVVKFATDITERKASEAMIDSQQRAIMELSTPAMQLLEDIILMPLVGNIDSERAGTMIDKLLGTISASSASVAILDVTGVPVIDTNVARYLLKTVSAAKMLGAEVILTGIQPSGAQTLVQLGIDLSGVTTKGSLRAGIQEAMLMTGLKLVAE
jgi:PAS domain S-box-containing protein